MRLDLDTEIRYPSGERAGILKQALLDDKDEVTDIVMSIGRVLSHQVVVPVSALSEGPGGVLYINLDPDQVDQLPDYTERVPAVTGEWEVGGDVEPVGEAFPATTYEPVMPVMEVQNVDPNEISITQGTEVRCLDGRWGIVDEVLVDEHGKVTAFVGRADVISEHDRLIPIELVRETSEEAVVLNCNIADLDAYTQELVDEQEEPEPS